MSPEEPRPDIPVIIEISDATLVKGDAVGDLIKTSAEDSKTVLMNRQDKKPSKAKIIAKPAATGHLRNNRFRLLVSTSLLKAGPAPLLYLCDSLE
jgi:hypothetical protein